MPNFRQYIDNFWPDLIAGATASVVALPQSMAYAILAGAPPVFGLYTSVVSTIVGGLFGSSNHLITGPTNGTAIVFAATLSSRAGEVDYVYAMALYTFMIGLVKFGFGALRLGHLVKYVSDSVIIGFTAGAGILIVGNQLRSLLGVDVEHTPGAALLPSVWNALSAIGTTNAPTVLVGLGTIALIVGLQRFDRRIPGALVACVLAGAVTWAFDLHGLGVRIAGDIGPIPRRLPPFSPVPFDLDLAQRLATGAIAVGFIGLMEATAISKSIAAWTGQRLDSNREFIAQGLANMSGAFFHNFAASGSLTRSALNYQSGARTRAAGVYSGFLVAIVVLVFGPLGEYIPIASLAGLLVVVAFQMVNRDRFRLAMRAGRESTIVLFVTFAAVLLVRLDIAIGLGVGVSLAFFIGRSAQARVTLLLREDDGGFREVPLTTREHEHIEGRIAVINLIGALYFGALSEHRRDLERIVHAEPRAVVLRLRRVTNIDSSGLADLESLHAHLDEHGIPMTVCGVDDRLLRTLERAGFIDRVGRQNVVASKDLVFNSIATSVERAEHLAEETGTDPERPHPVDHSHDRA